MKFYQNMKGFHNINEEAIISNLIGVEELLKTILKSEKNDKHYLNLLVTVVTSKIPDHRSP